MTARGDSATTKANWLYCPKCRYDLDGIPEGPCPECGSTFTHESLRREHSHAGWRYWLDNSLWAVPLLVLILCLVTDRFRDSPYYYAYPPFYIILCRPLIWCLLIAWLDRHRELVLRDALHLVAILCLPWLRTAVVHLSRLPEVESPFIFAFEFALQPLLMLGGAAAVWSTTPGRRRSTLWSVAATILAGATFCLLSLTLVDLAHSSDWSSWEDPRTGDPFDQYPLRISELFWIIAILATLTIAAAAQAWRHAVRSPRRACPAEPPT